MKRFSVKDKFNFKEFAYKALIFLTTVVVILYFLPREGKFNYQFDIGKPWKYGQLIATFDFPIYKSDDVAKRERDSLLKNFSPYFDIDKNVEKQEIEQLKENYKSHLKSIVPSERYISYIESKLKEIYRKGVISTDLLDEFSQNGTNTIQIIDNNMALPQNLNETYSVREAYNAIIHGDSTRFRADILRQCSLNEYIRPNLMIDSARSETARNELLENYSWANGMVISGQKIVDRGEIVNQHTYNILESLRKESIKRNETDMQKQMNLLGQILFVCFMMACFISYLELFRKNYFECRRNLALMFSLIVIYTVATSLMVEKNIFSIYILPYAMLPIMLRVFLDSRTALIGHLVTILTCSIILKYPHDFILLQLAVGVVAIFSLKDLYQRSQLFKTAILVILTYSAVFFSIELMTENDISKIDVRMFVYFVINGILLLFAYPLLFMVEKIFGFTSNVTLVELSNTNTTLLRQMSDTAPGTFQHSLQVASLAAEAANRIGANSQLVRTGALYHDIGKMLNPVYFTENKPEKNPINNLSAFDSSKVIISHVTEGMKLAEKHNLPKVIRDFIVTHHGKTKPGFFYRQWKLTHPDEEPDEATIPSYPGPDPFTKEQALLMMADAVEAASRSLSEYTEENISAKVEEIVNGQVQKGSFKNCPITFKDISTVKAVFKEKIKIMHHTRISYPELKK